MVRSIVWMSERLIRALREHLSRDVTVVQSAQEFLDARRDAKSVSFIDAAGMIELDRAVKEINVSVAPITPPDPVIVICEEPLQGAIGWLPAHPWLSHVVSAAMLPHPMVKEHLANVMSTLIKGGKGGQATLLDWFGPNMAGRRIRLAHARKRADRLDRMSDFFDSKGVSARTVGLLRDAAEELLTNAFYDAPVAAGALDHPISRTQDVSLPEDGACDMVYGCRDDLAIVRVRDPFGSLSRTRLVEVLTRCARTDMQVEVDETMGGAGLGLWRVFTAASFVAISVLDGRHTEFLVGIGRRAAGGPRPFAFHFFFKNSKKRRFWKLMEDQTSKPSIKKSVTVLVK